MRAGERVRKMWCACVSAAKRETDADERTLAYNLSVPYELSEPLRLCLCERTCLSVRKGYKNKRKVRGNAHAPGEEKHACAHAGAKKRVTPITSTGGCCSPRRVCVFCHNAGSGAVCSEGRYERSQMLLPQAGHTR
jgi:hypothetical protein